MSMAACSNACGGFTVAAGAASAAARRGSRKQAAASAIMSQPRVRQQSPRLAASSRARAGRSSVACAAAGEADLRKVIETLCEGTDLTDVEAESAMSALLDATPAQIAAYLVLLRAKGETPAEMAGMARAMQSRMVSVEAGDDVLDIVGTGGDDAGTVNISTGSCILAAAAGAKVAKHGNRSVSSLCGSADVLEALGVAVDLGPEGVAKCVEEVGMGFMYAPRYHPAMAAVAPVRKALKVRTAFNLMGPLLNPARSKYALVGVYGTEVQPLMAGACLELGMKKALVVHSLGLDELTPCGPADVYEVTPEGVKSYTFEPKDVGIPSCTLEDLKGGDAAHNAAMLRDALGGEKGPVADTLMLNAGVAMAAAAQAESVAEGIAMCKEAHASGAAGITLQKWIDLSQELKAAE